LKLYALCDENLLLKYNMSIEEFVKRAKKYKAEVIQYRNKSSDVEYSKKQLIKLRKLYDGFLIINDFVELVEFCDGVHLGQDDLKDFDEDTIEASKKVRKLIGEDKLFGLSTHNESEIALANKIDLNYIGLGAYRKTTTKDVSNILGEKLIEYSKKSTHPVAAIGGLKLNDKIDVAYKVVGSNLYEN